MSYVHWYIRRFYVIHAPLGTPTDKNTMIHSAFFFFVIRSHQFIFLIHTMTQVRVLWLYAENVKAPHS